MPKMRKTIPAVSTKSLILQRNMQGEFDELTAAIDGLTDRVFAYRIARIIQRGTRMALEIKGLKGRALLARKNIDALNAAYDKFNTAAPAHASDVEGLATQVGTLASDLEFAANVLGNSVEQSDTPQPGHPSPFDRLSG